MKDAFDILLPKVSIDSGDSWQRYFQDLFHYNSHGQSFIYL